MEGKGKGNHSCPDSVESVSKTTQLTAAGLLGPV